MIYLVVSLLDSGILFKCKGSGTPRRVAQKILVEGEDIALHIVDAAVHTALIKMTGNSDGGDDLFVDCTVRRDGCCLGCRSWSVLCRLLSFLFLYRAFSDRTEDKVKNYKAEEYNAHGSY